MNEQNTMQPLGETKSLQNIVIDEVCQKISDAVIDAEATSEEKYITKQKLIVSADDMNTQEQLDAMDRNYDRRNQERWQNVLYFAVVSFNVLESNLFYEVPLEFHQMCYELGQYRIAQDQIKAINMAAKKMDNSDTFVDTWRAMMESNYLKEAQPHEGSYHMHLNELLVNVTACLENWVDEYVPTHKKEIQQYFYGDLNKRLQESYDEFLKTTQSE